MPQNTLLTLNPIEGQPSLCRDLWEDRIVNSMLDNSWTLADWDNFFSAAQPSLAKSMRRKFQEWLGNSDETESFAENIFYSKSRNKFFLGQVIYDPESRFTSKVQRDYDKNLRCFHTQEHSFYVNSQNVVLTCGMNSFGVMGLGLEGYGKLVRTPTRIPFFAGISIKTIVVFANSTLFLTKEDEVFACGYNYHGNLGQGHTYNVHTPTKITFPAGTVIEKIVMGIRSAFFITNEGKVFACGDNQFRILGLREHAGHFLTPTMITFPESTVIEKIVIGSYSAFFITNEGKVFACGKNECGELGLGHMNNVFIPTRIIALSDTVIKHINAGDFYTFFITQKGRVFMCGKSFTNLGLEPADNLLRPELILALKDVAIKQIVVVHSTIYFLTCNGQVLTNHPSGDNLLNTIQPVEALQNEVVVKIQYVKYKCLLFITLDGAIIERKITENEVRLNLPWNYRIRCDRSNLKTIANFHSFLPEKIIALQLPLKRLELNWPVGWLAGGNKFTTSTEESYLHGGTRTPVFMTQWLLSYPMEELRSTLGRSDITPEEISITKNVCNQKFSELLNIIDKNGQTQPLVLEHTQKSITPKVMELALTYLNSDNMLRLIPYLSASQTQHWLAFTEKARQKYEKKNLRSGWNPRRAGEIKTTQTLHKALLQLQRAKALPARTP